MSHFLASQDMERVRRRLDNGLSVRLHSQPWLNRAAICLRVNAGSHDEPLAYPGLAHFLEHLLFLGGVGFIGEQRLLPFVQSCAGQVNATTQARYTEYFCEVPSGQLDGALARLIDMVSRPLLGEIEQGREREVVHAEFIARSQDATTLVGAALGQALTEGHRCGIFQAGNRETLPVEDAAFQAALLRFHDTYYKSGNCQLSIVAPLPVDELYALAQRHGQCIGEGCVAGRKLPEPMLPLRANYLRLNLPGEALSLHIGFALELSDRTLEPALPVLQSKLTDERPGGVGAQGREYGLVKSLDAQVLYHHAGQALLLMSFRGVASPADTLALLLDWLAFVSANADVDAWFDSYKQIEQKRLHCMSPLALARVWSEPSCCEGETLSALLQQLQDPSRRCVLISDDSVLPEWSGAGFPLRMEHTPAFALPARRGRWKLPAANPFHSPEEPIFIALGVPAALTWLPAPKVSGAAPAPIAVWQACLNFAEPLGAAFLLNLAKISTRAIHKHLIEVGISLIFEAEPSSLIVTLKGHVSLVPRALALLMPALLQPMAASFSAALADVSTNRQSMPIRQLLTVSAELLIEPSAYPQIIDSRILQLRHSRVRIHALGVGLDHDAQRQITAMFTRVLPLQSSARAFTVKAGRHWRTCIAEGESALLLFCPQPEQTAATEACWRVLGQLHQGMFYQRLRSELQLGYAVFCRYQQIQGQRGLLFGVQSPCCSAEQILEHIQAFLQARSDYIDRLDPAELACAVNALSCQWQVQSLDPEGLAEQAWQAHIAGLASEHDQSVQQALQEVSLDALQQAQQALNHGVGGWYVLSNDEQPSG